MAHSTIKLLFGCLLSICGCTNLPESSPRSVPYTDNLFSEPKTWKAVRERGVVMQGRDYSCGAASLATLLAYYFGDYVSESEIIDGILEVANKEELDMVKIKKKGFSLLSLKDFAESRGYQAIGIKLDIKNLHELKGPIILHMKTLDGEHFVVFRGIHEDRVYIADPARGNLRMTIFNFADEWTGVALALGKRDFLPPENYPLKVQVKDDGSFRMELQTARQYINSRL